MANVNDIKRQSLAEIEQIQSVTDLEDIRLKYLGKKGLVTEMLKGMGTLSAEDRKIQGPAINSLKNQLLEAIDSKKSHLELSELNKKLQTEKIDITLPGRPEEPGKIHPISQTIDELITIFGSMGFTLAEGPNIEDDYHNFTALNIAENHPARQEQDTFYMKETKDGHPLVLRTHTSPVQIRTMLNQKPPYRIVSIGRVFRADYDMTHTPMFHQTEALFIDKNINMGHLKGCLIEFLETFFGVTDLPVRFRPSYFPFTEPSAEVDIGCSRKDGDFKIGKGADWMEILGCGMVHPNVLRNCNLDPEEYQGFAFGMGIERIAMLKYGIPDLRTFFESDLRWLRHYGFRSLDIPSALNKTSGES
jgi:phenylalanyl-tRNA synthetase alpha chain